MKFLESYPSDRLAPFIKSFWSMTGTLKPGHSVVSRDIPNGDHYLIFNFGSPLIQRNSSDQRIKHSKSLFRANGKKAILFEQTETISLFGISFHPWGIYPFVDNGIHEFKDSIFPAADLLEPTLEEKLYGRSFLDQKQIAETWLTNKLTNEKKIPPVVVSSASYVMNHKGMVQIRELSERYNISMKHLERSFSEVTGITPKQFARLQKINGVIEHLKTNKHPDWIGLTERYRFYDQSHFSKEFKSHTGASPTRFIQVKDTLFENYSPYLEFV